MSNSNKPIKFSHLQKLANESILNGTLLMKMAKTLAGTFMKAENSLVVR